MRPSKASVDPVKAGVGKAFLATAAYAALHSALASETAKNVAERWVGTRKRNAFYRPMFNVVAVTTTAGLIAYVWRLPDRRLYKVQGAAAVAMRGGQLLSLAYLLWAAISQDMLGFIGLPQLWAYVTRRKNVPREPTGQGPSINPKSQRIKAAGPFARVRQPANIAFVPMLWLNPTLTVKWAAFNVAVTIYSILGSLHSDRMLQDAYGPAYRRYRQSGVPMLIPALRRPS